MFGEGQGPALRAYRDEDAPRVVELLRDIRNADGLIVISDSRTGSWGFRMQGFDGWNGHQWGMPNVSSAQDWDNGPDGAPKPQRVS